MKAVLAEKAFAAGNRKGHHDAIADLQLAVVLADLDHCSHRFMAKHVAGLHARHDAVEQVQIRPADGARGYLDDRIAS
jgi:hypothetical protein